MDEKENKKLMVWEENGTSLTAQELHKGISEVKITEVQIKALQEPIKESEISLRPDGIVYPSQIYVRNRLNDIFKPGRWALMRTNIHIDKSTNKVFFDGVLFINGSFIAQAIGENQYHPNNPMDSWAVALEGAKSDSLKRCCKDLGLFKELWDGKFVKDWLDKNAIQVWTKNPTKQGDKPKPLWRRKTDQPFNLWNCKETGLVQMLKSVKNGKQEIETVQTQPEAQISDEPVGNNTKPNKDESIGSASWSELCKLANNSKHPEDHQPFSVVRLVNKCTRSNVFGISGPKLSIAQREIAEEWLRQWENGTYKEV